MESADSQWTALVGHPSMRSDPALGVDARVQIGESGVIVFRYVLRGEISRVRIPPAKSAQRADGLWKHTCVEAFIRSPDASGYYEFNFAPSRQWAVYRFSAYRAGISSVDLNTPPEISVRRLDNSLEVEAAVRLHDLIALRDAPRLQIALSAAVEEENGTLSYWALKHAPGEPDFHALDGFVLELATQANR